MLLILILLFIIGAIFVYKKHNRSENKFADFSTKDLLQLSILTKEIHDFLKTDKIYLDTISLNMVESSSQQKVLNYEDNEEFDLNEVIKSHPEYTQYIRFSMFHISEILKSNGLNEEYIKHVSNIFQNLYHRAKTVDEILKEEEYRIKIGKIFSVKQSAAFISIMDTDEYVYEFQKFRESVVEEFQKKAKESPQKLQDILDSSLKQ